MENKLIFGADRCLNGVITIYIVRYTKWGNAVADGAAQLMGIDVDGVISLLRSVQRLPGIAGVLLVLHNISTTMGITVGLSLRCGGLAVSVHS